VPLCLLVRHGNSTANAEGVLSGRLPGIHLDQTGRDQVAALASRFRGLGVVRVVTSPLERCVETAEAVAEALGGCAVDTDEGLVECGYGAWTGRALRDLAAEPLWRTVQDQPSAARFPDHDGYAAEGLLEMGHRAVAAVRRLDAEVEAGHGPRALWVAVSHGDVIKAVLADAAGSHVDHFQRFRADPASVSVVHYTARRPFLVAANDTGSDLTRFVPPPPPAEDADGAGEQSVPEGDAVVGGGSATGAVDARGGGAAPGAATDAAPPRG
jgi:2,3-bisphosphoglycerate-dependent phosphoglycerate mutase